MADPLLEALALIPGAEDIRETFERLLREQPPTAPDLAARRELHALLSDPDFDESMERRCADIVARTGTGPDLVELMALGPSEAAWPAMLALAEPIEVLRLMLTLFVFFDVQSVRDAVQYYREIRGRTPAPLTPGEEIAKQMLSAIAERPWYWAPQFGSPMQPAGSLPEPQWEPQWETRQAYALLDAPERVGPGEEFALMVGLSEQPGPGVLQAEPFSVPRDTFELEIKLATDGLRVDQPVVKLSADSRRPYPATMVRLTALDDPRLAATRVIMATYSIDGCPIGFAVRMVQVGSAATEEPTASLGPAFTWTDDDLDTAPDLVIALRAGDDSSRNRLIWSMISGNGSVRVPDRPLQTVVDDAAGWARRVIDGIEARRDAADLGAYLRGVGAMIAEAVPDEVWSVLTRAARELDRRPTVLLCTDEPDIPWELATVPGEETCLGALAAVGRWVIRKRGSTPMPPSHLHITRLAVVAGRYRYGALPEADAEVVQLIEAYRAQRVEANAEAVLQCLGGRPPVEAVHFALHAQFNPSGYEDGLVMNDGTTLDPISVRGVRRSPVQLVFMNACQAARGSAFLGVYAGLAPSFLHIGTGALVAPLWKIDDADARAFATDFYNNSESIADFLARQRSAGRLAYLFFGHPALMITGLGAPARVRPPDIWGGVPPRQHIFTGGARALHELHGALASKRLQVLVGMAGVGKTQLAVQYAHQYRGDYDLVWWSGARKPSYVLASMTSLAQRLGISERTDPATATAEVLGILGSGGPVRRWLLVFDDAGDPDLLSEYLPAGPAGHVLITTRDPSWARYTAVTDVDVLTARESAALLRFGRWSMTEDEMTVLADRLGHLPLALLQTVMYQSAMSCEEFLRLLDSGPADLLDAAEPVDHAPLTTSVRSAYEELSTGAAAALDRGLAEGDGPAWIPVYEHGEALAWELVRSGLARAEGDGVMIPSIVAAILRDRPA